MSKTDEFDEFLNRGFEQNRSTVADEGFTERVMSSLPADRIPLISRRFILYVSSIISVFIFFISNGYKALFLSIIDILNKGFQCLKPSPVSLFVILAFISVSFIISGIENNEDLI